MCWNATKPFIPSWYAEISVISQSINHWYLFTRFFVWCLQHLAIHHLIFLLLLPALTISYFTVMFTLLSGLWKYSFQKDEYFVLILGLDNAGKTVNVLISLPTFFIIQLYTTFYAAGATAWGGLLPLLLSVFRIVYSGGGEAKLSEKFIPSPRPLSIGAGRTGRLQQVNSRSSHNIVNQTNWQCK